MSTRLVIVVAALLSSAMALSLGATELPKRKPGHWQLTTVSAGSGMVTTDVCVGPDDNIAVPADSGECSEPKVTPAGSEVIVDVVCKRPYGRQIMSTAFGGDFNSRYNAIMRITFDPPEGLPNAGVTIEGKYIGPDCPAETKGPQKP